MLFPQDTEELVSSQNTKNLYSRTYHCTASATVVVINLEIRAGTIAQRFATVGANASTS